MIYSTKSMAWAVIITVLIICFYQISNIISLKANVDVFNNLVQENIVIGYDTFNGRIGQPTNINPKDMYVDFLSNTNVQDSFEIGTSNTNEYTNMYFSQGYLEYQNTFTK